MRLGILELVCPFSFVSAVPDGCNLSESSSFRDEEYLLSPMATHLLNYYCCESLCCEWIIIHFPAEMMMCSGPCWISVSPKLLFLPWEGPWGQWEGGGNLATGSGREKKWGGLQKERPWKCVAGRMAANLQMALGLTHEMRCPGGVHSGLALRPCSVVQNWHSS